MPDLKRYVFDTETASDKDGCGVCDIAFIEIDEQLNPICHFGSRIDPEEPITCSASGVHRIVNCMVDNEPTLEEYLTLMRLKAGAMVGHNVAFDIDKIKKHVAVPLSVDTLLLAQRFIPGADNYKLATLVYHCELPKPSGEFHSAMPDTWSCFYLLKHIAEVSGLRTFTELATESNTPRQLKNFPPFGKHAGIPFADVPTSYLQWCLKNFEKMDMDLKYSIDMRLKR